MATMMARRGRTIRAIARRALADEFLGPYDMESLCMDLEAADCNIPLRLEEFLDAKQFDFRHDLSGIVHHMNRETGEIEDCFVPRFAAKTRPKGLPKKPPWLICALEAENKA